MANWSIAGVALPTNPHRVTIDVSADYKEITIPGNKALLISLGGKADKMRIEGVLLDNSKTKAQIESTWIVPYRSAMHTSVAVLPGDGTVNISGNWVLTKFVTKEIGGYTVSYEYDMELVRGHAQSVVIT